MKETKTFQGFLEKIFWISIPIILVGVVSLIPMIYGLKTDMKVLEVKSDTQQNLLEKTWGVSTANNVILQGKADEVTNNTQHTNILGRVITIENILEKIYKRQGLYGYQIDTIPFVGPLKPYSLDYVQNIE